MNKNYRVIKINGFRGVLTAIFVVCCLITGFIVFPGWVFMNLWNYISSFYLLMPKMELIHGIILWAIIALTFYGINNNRLLIGFSAPPSLNDEQIKDIMTRVKNTANATPPLNSEITEDEKDSVEALDEVRK